MDSGNAIIILGKQNIYPCYFTQVLSFVNEVKTIIPFPRSDDFTNTLLCILSHSRILKIMQTEMKKPDYQIIRRFISSKTRGIFA